MVSKNKPVRVAQDFKLMLDNITREMKITSAEASKLIAEAFRKRKFK